MIIDFQVRPFTLRMKGLSERKGLLLCAKDETGNKALAEVSPLPGFSKETLEDAYLQLQSLESTIKTSLLDVLKENLLPSVSFGLDSLAHSLSAPVKPTSYPLCGFLSGSFQEMQQEIPFLLREDYEHIKIKVSKLSLEEAHHVIKSLLGKAKLKIDVNRSWSLEKSLSFFSKYPLDAFEYIEEPVQHVKDLAKFPYPIALDETLREEKDIPPLRHIKAFILKPMMIGGVNTLQHLLDQAKQRKVSVTLSSSYESGVGLFHLCELIERAKIPLHPLGVDTHRLFYKDLLATPHTISKGRLTLSPLEVIDAPHLLF